MAIPGWAKWTGIAVLGLILLSVLFYAEEDWRGSREWARVEKELRARGEPLTLDEVRYPAIPDEQNVAAATVFSQLSDHVALPPRWNELSEPLRHRFPLGGIQSTDSPDMKSWEKALTGANGPRPPAESILEVLQKQEPFLAEIKEALKRPSAQWPAFTPENLFPSLPYLNACIKIAQYLQLKAIAQVEAGQADAALDTIQLSFRVAWVTGQGDTLINYLIQSAVDSLSLSSVMMGLQKHVWNDRQLARLQEIVAGENSLLQFKASMRGERAFGLYLLRISWGRAVSMVWHTPSPMMDKLWMTSWLFRPRGWRDLDAAYYALQIQNVVIDPVKETEGRIDAKWSREAKLKKGSSSNLLFDMAVSSLDSVKKAASAQAFLNEAVTACAVERYRLRKGQLPDATTDLVPDFLPSLPPDPMTGQPLRYVRREDADYLLYSIGWNEKDEGGLADRHKKDDNWTWASRPDLYKFADEKPR